MRAYQKLLFLAWRNIFRNKRRGFLTMSVLVLGCSGLIIVGGFFHNMIEAFGEVFLHSQTGHIQVNVLGYNKKGARAPFEYLLPDVTTLQKKIQSNPNVKFTVPRLKLQGMVSSGETAIAVMALGVDPALEKEMGSFQPSRGNVPSTNIVEGQDLDAADPYGVLLGKGLLEALGLHVGDPVTFITTRQAGALDGAELHVRGVFETYVKDFDDRALKMDLTIAQKILGLSSQVHSLLVILKETSQTDRVKEELERDLKSFSTPLEFFTWVQQGQYYRQSKNLLWQIYKTIQAIICVIFFFSIANTINMVVLERIREFGTMMAIGNSRLTIFSLIFLETILLGLIGTVLGLFIGSGLAEVISIVGIPMQPPQSTGVFFCRVTFWPGLFLQTFVISMVSTFLSAIYPGYRASHFPIIHALGYV